MSPQEYTTSVLRTESPNYHSELVDPRIMHGVIGISTEAAELLDAVKKSLFYGKPLDLVNLQEEIGDLMYYTFLLIDAVGGDFNQILQTNRNKLAARYKEKFTADEAISRDLDSERTILEAGAA